MASQVVSRNIRKILSSTYNLTKRRVGYGWLWCTDGGSRPVHTERPLWVTSSAPGKEGQSYPKQQVPTEAADIVVVGSGIIGANVAYFLGRLDAERRLPGQPPLRIVLVEGDTTFAETASMHSFGGIRQQFTIPENILMSLFTSQFVKNAQEHLQVEGEDTPDPGWREQGYLFVTSDPTSAEKMVNANKLQRELGAQIDLLTPAMIKSKFPWIKTDDIILGSFGSKNEGWINLWSFMQALQRKAKAQGCSFIDGQVTGFGVQGINGESDIDYDSVTADRRVQSVQVQLADRPKGDTVEIQSSAVVLTAGLATKGLARLLGVGEGPVGSLLHPPIFTEAAVRHHFSIHAPDGPAPMDTVPFVIDTHGTYFRPDSKPGHYKVCRGPKKGTIPTWSNEVDYDFFYNTILPELAHRVPSFKEVKITNAVRSGYEMNSVDSNAIIGGHPAFTNLYMATAFSGHGIMHSSAAARGLSELILFGGYRTIDLSRLGFDRYVQESSMESEFTFC
ncbi:FAD-dependent oxidoreductase domain-containing protein 1-like isoform X1 [Asterias rubens]|uniref:FAD-dependent oxidoreductase domain-containing protein 1-like isoform X1 n=2 Tax=Asterias rubens TaxID=7604 RepID=UPI001454ED0D|nr:FAD-dependent oxidoreductase domain-containing protein 1-like isoform X1 [Asterias rubens]